MPKKGDVRNRRAHETGARTRHDRGAPGPKKAQLRQVAVADARRLAHELDVHRVELEAQNQELHASRLETEKAAARSTEYMALFDFAPIAYVVLGRDGKLRELNHAASSLLEVPRSRAVGYHFSTFLAVPAHETFAGILASACATEGTAASNVPLLTLRGQTVVSRMKAFCLDQAAPTFLVSLEDITEEDEREQRLVCAERELREADQRKDEFLAMLSHELRNPLAPIHTSLHLIDKLGPHTDALQRAIDVIDRQVEQLTHLVDDLLDVNRIRQGKSHLRREHLELDQVVRRTVEDLRSSFQIGGIQLDLAIEEGTYWVDGDPARLIQVLTNILGNAKKFTMPGGTVTVTLDHKGTDGLLSVRDTGIGIAADQLRRVFDPFTRVQRTNDLLRGGLGLGLMMVKGFVQLHGGSVDVHSPGAGKGTEVVVRLPLESPPESRECLGAPRRQSKRKIVVIDDDPDLADGLKEVLSLLGHDVRVALDGASGIELARTFCPDVAICDISMPGLDGYDVARRFRADPELRATYLIALSGYARLEDMKRAAAAGYNRHHPKPPDLDALERIVAEAPVREADPPPAVSDTVQCPEPSTRAN